MVAPNDPSPSCVALPMGFSPSGVSGVALVVCPN